MVLPNLLDNLFGMNKMGRKENNLCITDIVESDLLIPGHLYYVLSGVETLDSHAFAYICPPEHGYKYLLIEAVQGAVEVEIKFVNQSEIRGKIADILGSINWYKTELNKLAKNSDAYKKMKNNIWEEIPAVDASNGFKYRRPIPLLKTAKFFEEGFDTDYYDFAMNLLCNDLKVDNNDPRERSDFDNVKYESIKNAIRGAIMGAAAVYNSSR